MKHPIPYWKELLVAIAILLPAFDAQARNSWDLDVGAAGRSYPLAPVFLAKGGFTKTFWGDSEKGWKYGYVRTSGKVFTNSVINAAGAQIEFFPVSIFGIKAGYRFNYRLDISPDFECVAIQCQGFLSLPNVSAHTAFAVGKLILIARGEIEWLDAPSANRPFLHSVSNLPSDADGDLLLSAEGTIGYRINDRWMAGTRFQAMSLQESGNHNQQLVGFGRWQPGNWSLLAGAGAYQSTVQDLGFVFIFSGTYRWGERIGFL